MNKNGKKEDMPNCILIAADQLRFDVLGKGYTPNIDALMKDSVRFSNAYCASPLCVPARGALFTGTYPGVNGSLINGWFPPEEPYSRVKEGTDHLYSVMERLGMECIHSGKQHLFVEGIPLEARPDTKTRWLTTEASYRAFVKGQGKRLPGGPLFTTPIPEMADGVHTTVCAYSNPHTGRYEGGYDCYFDGYFTNTAVKALDGFAGEKPLFLSMMYVAPHPPFDIPDPWYSLVKTEDVELPDNVNRWYEHQSPLQKYNLTGYIGSSYRLEDWREAWRTYLGLVSLLDQCVGRIIGKLKEKDLYENSIIVFTSDHGEMLGSHCLFQKMCMYEESAKTPFSIHLPGGRKKGTVREEFISHIDLFPTICDFYEVTPTGEVNGTSLKELLEETESFKERPVYIQYDGNGSRGNFQRCVIWKNYKYIVDVFKDEYYLELYDLKNDRQETKNLLFEKEEDKKSRYWEAALELNRLLNSHLQEIQDDLALLPWNPAEFLENYNFNRFCKGGF
ncbi:sulfatase family protein [Lacrimispora sp.]|uniref:sulfatase family protein n=1 Tax=Lacrimispora sp. TaxID=2719234 RepID=UPI0028B1AB25|nr:sulfatase-like hydrolase/transferase [Lacrimispora sp.]